MELYCWNKMGARNIRTAILAILMFLTFIVLSESILIKYIQVLGYRAYITQKISYIVFFFIALGFAWLIKNVANLEPIKISKISNTSICLLVVTGITATILDIGILGSHVYIASFISYEYAVSLYDFKESTLTIAPNEKLGNSFNSIVLFIICQVILAPLIEEIYFRGIIFKQLYQRGGFIFAAIISSLVFCVLHPQNLWLAVFISGLVYCYIYIKTNNLLYSIVLHSITNLLGWLATGFGVMDFVKYKNPNALSSLYTWRFEVMILIIFSFFTIYFLKCLTIHHNK